MSNQLDQSLLDAAVQQAKRWHGVSIKLQGPRRVPTTFIPSATQTPPTMSAVTRALGRFAPTLSHARTARAPASRVGGLSHQRWASALSEPVQVSNGATNCERPLFNAN
jgi:hypothetical protein